MESLATRAPEHFSIPFTSRRRCARRDKLDIFVAGGDARLYGRPGREVASGQWRGWWNILTGANPPGGRTAVARDPGKLDVFIVSTDGGSTRPPGIRRGQWQWRGWWRIGTLVASRFAGGRGRARREQARIFVAGNDGRTYSAAWDANVANGAWRGWWNILTGAIPAGGTIYRSIAPSREGSTSFSPAPTEVSTRPPGTGMSQADSGAGWWRDRQALTTEPGAPVAAVGAIPTSSNFAAANDGRRTRRRGIGTSPAGSGVAGGTS